MCRRPRVWGLEQFETCDLGPNESSCICRAIVQALLGFRERQPSAASITVEAPLALVKPPCSEEQEKVGG